MKYVARARITSHGHKILVRKTQGKKPLRMHRGGSDGEDVNVGC
jgi:hypothetical protein